MQSTTRTKFGMAYRDLNKNGVLDPYEDPRRPVDERVEDLVARMTLAEKAGLLFHTYVAFRIEDSAAFVNADLGPMPTGAMVTTQRINHFNFPPIPEPRLAAQWHNKVQALAEDTRLGIPVTFSSDPLHGFSDNPAANLAMPAFSRWPEPPGLAAIGDPALVQEFGDIARREYVAVGIRVALHPTADLATEPRWARTNGTFGEDADLASQMTAAYIRGFQGEALGPDSVACMTKHFPGGGPQKDGEDAHFAYGREQVYPGDNFEYHLIPFEAAFAAGTAQIMPYYGMPVGTALEEVGFGFHKEVVTGLLRERYGFDGVICTDWGLLTDRDLGGALMIARAWGVEHLSVDERVAKALNAGVDQFGGESCPEVVVGLAGAGVISEERLDESVRRLLRDKFRLGLFDDPYVDPDMAESVVGSPEFRAAGETAQRRSIVVLKNGEVSNGTILPLRGRPKLYIENVAPDVAAEYGEVVANVKDADVAILRLRTPFEPRDREPLETFFHAGDLSFGEEEKARIVSILTSAPTVVDIYLDRPAVIPEIARASAALLANFGASDAALLDVVFGRFSPTGMLPFELPSSMDAVRRQKEDVPYDSEHPLFPFGHGLVYGDDGSP
ncbi:MAG: glycoside hydrolase family 3 C-terminal domain-containing protein [Chloroflexia bacterium]|nr:glycoside hydrolase family 3 C-terminal domain-containing protein [Chloroflexia bacterium]